MKPAAPHLRYGQKLGQPLKELILIVSYQTFRRWVREKEEAHTAKRSTAKRKHISHLFRPFRVGSANIFHSRSDALG